MLGSQKVLNKIFQHKYLTGFWICLEFWKHQCYTGFCRKQPVIHVCQVSEYSLGSQSARAWTCMVLPLRWNSPCCDERAYPPRSSNQSASTRRAQLSVKICQGSEYIRVLNMLGFIKKTLHRIDAWQGTDYSSGHVYTRVLNMLRLHKVLKKMLHHRYLTGFQIFLRFWTCHGFKYARVTQGSEQNTPL